MNESVSLMEMLDARERRVRRQESLLKKYRAGLICFTMNIAGPVKDSPLIRRGFDLGCVLLERQLIRLGKQPLYREILREHTGCEAFYVVDLPAVELKAVTVEIEEGSALGRLFDMDVLAPDGAKLERGEERRCLICGGPARSCARSRAHTVEELQEKTNAILRTGLDAWDAEEAARLAVTALLWEVCTTPKPGLVDCLGSGSHRDMDIFTFMSSAAALQPYFARCVRIGRDTAERPAAETFSALRGPGKLAEGDMLAATGGVNTHKGAVFTMGVLCAAIGRLPREKWAEPEVVCRECAAMTEGLVERELGGITEDTAATAGQRLYARYGVTGVRGQVEAGLPAVLYVGLPALERVLAMGKSLNDAGCAALLAMMAGSEDTNLMARGGPEGQRWAGSRAAQILEHSPCPDRETLLELDREFVEKNLSPGGSADLLAVCYLLYFLRRGGETAPLPQKEKETEIP